MEWYTLTDKEMVDILAFDENKQDINEINSWNLRELIKSYTHPWGEADLFGLKEHVFGTYWQRQIDKYDLIGDDIFSVLLNHLHYDTAACLLGDLAAKGKIANEQSQQIIDLLDEDQWASRQAKARLLLNDLKQRITLTEIEKIKYEIDQLIHLRACWSVKELLPLLNAECLNWLLNERMESREVFNRGHRHDLREMIKKQRIANEHAKARMLVDELKPKIPTLDIESIKNEIDGLIQLNASWAVQKLVPHLDKECLHWLLEERLESNKVFKKGDRNNIRDFIKKQLRKMNLD